MKVTRKISWWKGALASAALATACGAPQSGSTPFDPNGFDGLAHEDFGILAGTCTITATSVTATVADSEVAYFSIRPTDGMVVLNANDASAAPCVFAASKTITINSAVGDSGAGNRKLVLDYYNGQFALGTKTAVGITLAWAATTGTNSLVVRGTNGVDSYYFGASGLNVNAGTDQFVDVQLTNVGSITASTGGGNDVLNADGGKGTGASCAIPVTFWGGANDDTIVGGAGTGNVLNGGTGNDLFTQTATIAKDQIVGGLGTDTVDYTLRTGALSILLGDGNANDGDVAGNEQDEIMDDIENVTGGAGADTISAAASIDQTIQHTFLGLGGADTLTGGAVADVLDGGAGDDVLIGGLGNDTLTGGAGNDTADYSDRIATHPVVVTLVYASMSMQNGEVGEVDVINPVAAKPDVENLRGGADNDTLTGNSVANIIWGGAGNDTIYGGLGNDTLYGEAGTDTIYGCDGAGGGAIGTDDDTLNGGPGADTLKGEGGNNFVDAVDGIKDTLIDCGSGNSPLLVSDAADAPITNNCSFQ